MKKRNYTKKADVDTCHKYSLQVYTKIIKEPDLAQNELQTGQIYYCDLNLSEYRYQFDLNENIYLAIEILNICIKNNLYPPANVLNYLRLNLNNYLHSDKSLDDTFKASKRNKNSFNKNNRYKFIVIEIIKLLKFFDINLEESISAVYRLMEEKRMKLEGDTIKDIYNRYGKQLIEKTLMHAIDDLDTISEMSPDFRLDYAQELLSQYPEDIQRLLAVSSG